MERNISRYLIGFTIGLMLEYIIRVDHTNVIPYIMIGVGLLFIGADLSDKK